MKSKRKTKHEIGVAKVIDQLKKQRKRSKVVTGSPEWQEYVRRLRAAGLLSTPDER